MQTITMTVQTDDPMLAAMLRLVAAQGLPIAADALERPAADEPERLLLSVTLAHEAAPVAFDQRDPGDEDDARAAPQPDIEWLPPDEDAQFRPVRAAVDVDGDKRGASDGQLLVVSEMARNPRLADVAEHFLKPLAGRGYRIDGNVEAVLLRLANDLVGYQPRNLQAAAKLLLEGRHERFPDRKEVLAAFGEVMKPGAPRDQQKAA